MKNRREFIKMGAIAVGSAAIVTGIEYPILNSQIQQKDQDLILKDQKIIETEQNLGGLKEELDNVSRLSGFLSLNPNQRLIVETVADTMIPTDENGPGAKEAGVVYFIDRQLAGNYGKSGGMYLKGPFLSPGQPDSLTVDGIIYPKGTPKVGVIRGGAYQYSFDLREYWRRGLEFLQEYAVSAYGANFEDLSLSIRTQVLQELFDNKPTNFEGPTPIEFFFEMHDMVIAGFFTDPLHGGNRNMVGWKLIGSNGVNEGAKEGYSTRQLMLMKEPVRLAPMSLVDIQG